MVVCVRQQVGRDAHKKTRSFQSGFVLSWTLIA